MSTYGCELCRFLRCGVTGPVATSGSGLEARFLLVPAVTGRVFRVLGLSSVVVSTSDVSGVVDWTEVFVLNTGETTLEGVVEVDAADFVRALLLVCRAMFLKQKWGRKDARRRCCQVEGHEQDV